MDELTCSCGDVFPTFSAFQEHRRLVHDDGAAIPYPNGMPPCAACGHAWSVHARPSHIEADIDNGERWCYHGDCACRRWIDPGEPVTRLGDDLRAIEDPEPRP